MYKITETFKKLVKEKVIGNFNVTRLFAAGSIANQFEKAGISTHKVRKEERTSETMKRGHWNEWGIL